MGIRIQKRIGGNDGLGLNLSGSGLSSSYRSKYGAVGSRGFSIRSGIPGISFRSGWGGGKNKGTGAVILLVMIAAGFILYFAAVIFYNIAIFLGWGITELYHLSLRIYYKHKANKELKQGIV